ncbi:hypothetical protein J6590_101361 [Homalodisca vitripennis]|nr:hypothetical protein J6590_101361 [Homalodisca vitripennis]
MVTITTSCNSLCLELGRNSDDQVRSALQRKGDDMDAVSASRVCCAPIVSGTEEKLGRSVAATHCVWNWGETRTIRGKVTTWTPYRPVECVVRPLCLELGRNSDDQVRSVLQKKGDNMYIECVVRPLCLEVGRNRTIRVLLVVLPCKVGVAAHRYYSVLKPPSCPVSVRRLYTVRLLLVVLPCKVGVAAHRYYSRIETSIVSSFC